MRARFKYILIVSCISASISMAGPREELIQLRQHLEDRIGALFSKVDASSSVYVDIKVKRLTVNLAFAVPEQSRVFARNEDGDLQIEAIGIEILSDVPNFPPELLNHAKRLASGYGVVPSVKVTPLTRQLATPPMASLQSRTLLERLEALFRGPSGPTLVLAIFVFLFSILGLGFIWAVARASFRLQQELGQSSKNLAGAISSGTPRDAFSPTTSFGQAPSDADNSERYAPESLVAALTDCYWGEFDEYAAHLWYKAGTETQRKVLELRPALAEYIRTLADKQQVDMGSVREVYYLQPLPIEHLDNKDLTHLVRKYPSLLSRLPSMRSLRMELNPVERLTLLTKSGVAGEWSDLRGIKSSPPRPLTNSWFIPLRNTEEEEQILAMKNLPANARASILSIAWLAQIPQQDLRDLLDGFSARELASAWIGPKSVLARLSEAIPEKKRLLIESLCQKTPPSRNSPTFRRLHRLALEYSKNTEPLSFSPGRPDETEAA